MSEQRKRQSGRLTQADRLLRAFRREGERGLDPTQWLAPDVYDGKAPILNFGGRVADLRVAGHRLDARSRRHGCRVIVLVEAAPEPAPAATSPNTETPADATPAPAGAPLFEAESSAARSYYDAEMDR